MARWSLRRRLSVAVGLIILGVGATISTVMVLSVDRLLVDRVDDALRAFGVRPEFSRPPGAAAPNPQPAADPSPDNPSANEEADFRPVAIIVFGPDGTALSSLPSGFSDDPDPVADVAALTPGDLDLRTGIPFDLDDVEGGELRGLLSSTGDGWVLLTQSLEESNDLLNRVMLISALSTVLAAGVGALGSWWFLRRGFQPIDDMIDTASAIASGEHERRVGATGHSTELGRLGSALNNMMDRLAVAEAEREADAARLRRFVDDASHELRTPIAAIVGYTELYEQGGVHDRAQLSRAMGRIGEAGHRAERLIEDLLSLARLDHDVARRREAVDLESVVNELVAETVQVTGRDVRAETDGPVLIDGDRVWLTQALANVVRNAVDYAPPTEPIHVRLTSTHTTAQLSVIDHGPGVAESERDRVFDRFARQESGRDRAHGGAGLGLAIVREVMTGHHGEVGLTETPGGGTTVTMRFPITSGATARDE